MPITGPPLELRDSGRRHVDLRRGNLHRAVGGEGFEKVALEPRRPAIADGGGYGGGIVRGIVHLLIISVC